MVKLEYDENGYILGYKKGETEKILNSLDEYGVVVIEDVISQEDIEQSINAIWNHDELTSRGVLRNDPGTWERCWPQDGQIEKKGWISTYDDLLDIQSWKNRFTIYPIFQEIWKARNETNLRVNTDRYGVMRPILNPTWKTDESWLHTDQNPKEEHDFIRYQGILTFTDSRVESGGGFCCIPGFHKQWTKYCEKNPDDRDVCPFKNIDGLLSKNDCQKITVRPGSLIVWDSRLPHANFPNESQEAWRFVQYITYYPSHYDSEKRKRIRKEDAEYISTKISFDKDQLKLIGGN